MEVLHQIYSSPFLLSFTAGAALALFLIAIGFCIVARISCGGKGRTSKRRRKRKDYRVNNYYTESSFINNDGTTNSSGRYRKQESVRGRARELGKNLKKMQDQNENL